MVKKIVFVDDEKNLRELVSFILKHEGFDVKTFSSGAEALKKIDRINPDLIIVDMMMPKMNGKQIVANINKNSKLSKAKIMFLTVVESDEHINKDLQALHFDDYLNKPFTNTNLIKKVKNLLK